MVEDNPPKYPDLHAALLEFGDKGKPADSKRLGRVLGSLKNTNIKDKKFIEVLPRTHNAIRWTVSPTARGVLKDMGVSEGELRKAEQRLDHG
jgi:hypothetical protein